MDLAGARRSKSFSGATVGAQSLGHQKPIGHDAQHGVMMKSDRATPLVIPHSEILFQCLVVTLDAQTYLGYEHHCFMRAHSGVVLRKCFSGSFPPSGNSIGNHSGSCVWLRE